VTDRFQWLATEPLARRAATTPDRTALVDATPASAGDSPVFASTDDRPDREWTYRELDGLVDAIATEFDDLVPAECQSPRIGLAVSPRLEFVAALYGALRLGWTVAPLDPGMTGPELARRVERIDPALLVCDRTSAPRCRTTDRRVVSVDGPDPPFTASTPDGRSGGQTPDGRSGSQGSADSQDGGIESHDALLLFTSGTTGSPKAVRLTLYNLLASAIGAAFRLGVTPSDRWLGCLPVHHMGGLAPVFRSVFYGTTLVLQGAFDAAETARLLDEHDVTGVSLVPTQLRRLLDAGWSPSPSLRTVLLGGAPAGESLLDRAAVAGVPVCTTYGLTETASQVTTARPTDARTHPGTVGQPLACTTVRVVADGSPVAAGQHGEIVVDGPTVTPGYLDGDATDQSFSEWGLHTGDLGYRDEDGRLWVVGRLDDVVITGGELVAPAEVAETLESHHGVEEAAVVGIDDPEWGERVAALVVPEGVNSSPDAGTLREHCRGQLSAYKLPKTIVAADSVPRTDSGTVDRGAVADEIRRRREEDNADDS
jgi:O-succinylbenzoic acid--CoA ligase